MMRIPSCLLGLILLSACDDASPRPRAAALTVADAMGDSGDDAAYARATAPPTLSFPDDHGSHAPFRTEWWYVTANLDADSGRRFGVQLVFFRQALAPTTDARAGSLAARDLVFAHAAVTDVDGATFHHAERMTRAAGELGFVTGGREGAPFEVRCVDWSARASDGATFLPLQLRASDPGFAIDLTVEDGKPLVLQGDRGLSQKSEAVGNASIYYSMTRLPIRGALVVDGVRHEVAGLGWIDREWSTSALGPDQVGWDWFSLQLDDETEVMWYRLRLRDGSSDPWSRGCFVATNGDATRLLPQNVTATPVGEWTAPDGGAAYPARWRLQCAEPAFDLEVTPLLADQELHTLVRYWEGAVGVQGTRAGRPVRGRGYLEMTGYLR
ncbi:MAG: lipocalin-like domain-containing protein [Planctomycetota bacterium]|nr:lipocalin-like domain-containing protein [Planctomycetota bacterium]